jgi:bifunctional enzyme CysN/CysC/sulfate adenylyltransferase subunit 1
VDVNTLEERGADAIAMNEIAEVEFETNLPLFFDSYRDCRWTGSLILIDALSNATVGAAMIVAPVAGDVEAGAHGTGAASLVLLPGGAELAAGVRDALLARGVSAVVIDDPMIPDAALAAVVRALDLAGVVAISSRRLEAAVLREIEGIANGAVLVEEGLDDEAIVRSIASARG